MTRIYGLLYRRTNRWPLEDQENEATIYYSFLLNVLSGPLIGSTKTELPMYKKKKTPSEDTWEGKKKFFVQPFWPVLPLPSRMKISPPQLPRFPHVTHKRIEDGRNPFGYAAA